jgi:hypothetical protein
MTTEQEKQPEQQKQELFNPEELFRPIDEVCREAPPLEPLWGYFLFRKAVTSIVGDPGICKTTFGYGLGFALSSGEPFLDIAPEEPVKVLYLDFESSSPLVKSRKSLLTEMEMPNFFIYNDCYWFLPQMAAGTVKYCRENGINLIFIDNQSMAFNTKDENDNAEAIKQMRFVRNFTNACNASTVIFHHTSKANLPGTRKGTGAFARARLADICINLDVLDENHPDIVRLETVKNRLLDEKVLWYLKKEQGKFIFTDPPLGVARIQTNTQIYKAQQLILNTMEAGKEYKLAELIDLVSGNGLGEDTADHALRKLYQLGRIIKPRYGFYAKPLSSQVRKPSLFYVK